jgi:phosphoribosylformimino-5-aminoimidazole carboxamide ribotide isomerase
MEIIPAIDLKDGNCVRLYQGDYEQETIFSTDPVEVALEWQSLGAPRLHIVDLDGAAAGEPRNLDTITQIASTVWLSIQLGGGIRTSEAAERVLRAGVDRIILGTAAIENTGLVEEICHRFGDAVIIGIDARNGYVATQGWRKLTTTTAAELVQSMAALGAKRFIYTDISRDGTLTEPNFESTASLVASTELPIIAAGGISSIAHLRKLKQLGVKGAIVGRALYTGDINLKRALAELNQ